MIELFLFSFISFGITTIITQSKIFAKLREWAEKISPFFSYIVRCPICCGFWVGVFLSLTLFSPVGFIFGIQNLIIKTFFDACFSSGIVIMLDHFRYKLNPEW